MYSTTCNHHLWHTCVYSLWDQLNIWIKSTVTMFDVPNRKIPRCKGLSLKNCILPILFSHLKVTIYKTMVEVRYVWAIEVIVYQATIGLLWRSFYSTRAYNFYKKYTETQNAQKCKCWIKEGLIWQFSSYKVINVAINQSHLNQPPTLAALLSAVRIWLHFVRGHVHTTSLKIDMRNPVLICDPMKFLLIKLC